MHITDKDKQSLTLGLLWIQRNITIAQHHHPARRERWHWPVCVDGRHLESG
jgi:hypothetical protein